MKEKGKQQILRSEGNKYFERNKNSIPEGNASIGFQLAIDFLRNIGFYGKDITLVEIGCCYGYNLDYATKKLGGVKCIGIEPSEEAIKYGKAKFSSESVQLIQGTSDNLEIDTDTVDVVVCGFCLYTVERAQLLKTIAEIDRILKERGFIIIYDFDTPLPYKRENIHNKLVPVYKVDLASLIISNPQYTLVEKKSYSHSGTVFVEEIQERCAINIIYKEKIEEVYIGG